MSATYRVELSNKVVRGRAVGNMYGVGRYVDGCRTGYVLAPQESEQRAQDLADVANLAAEIGYARENGG